MVTNEHGKGEDGNEYVASHPQRVRDGVSRMGYTRRKILPEPLPEPE